MRSSQRPLAGEKTYAEAVVLVTHRRIVVANGEAAIAPADA